MKRLIGLSLAIALGLAALAAVPVAANSDNGTDVEHGPFQGSVPCYIGLTALTGIPYATTLDSLSQWHGDTSTLMCKFKGLDMSAWNGTKLFEGFGCGIAGNPESPYQPAIVATDTSLRVNAQGNATLRCAGTQPVAP